MLNMLLCSCLAWVIVYPLGFIRFKYKPLNCEKCLAGWLACGYCWHQWYTPLYMAGAMVGAVLLSKVMSKI